MTIGRFLTLMSAGLFALSMLELFVGLILFSMYGGPRPIIAAGALGMFVFGLLTTVLT